VPSALPVDAWDDSWNNLRNIRNWNQAQWSRFGPDPDWDARIRYWRQKGDEYRSIGKTKEAMQCATKVVKVGELKEGWIKWSETHNPVLSGRPQPRRSLDIISSIHAHRTMVTVQRVVPTLAPVSSAPMPDPKPPRGQRNPFKWWWDGVLGIWEQIFADDD